MDDKETKDTAITFLCTKCNQAFTLHDIIARTKNDVCCPCCDARFDRTALRKLQSVLLTLDEALTAVERLPENVFEVNITAFVTLPKE